jgi:hypothetical protein
MCVVVQQRCCYAVLISCRCGQHLVIPLCFSLLPLDLTLTLLLPSPCHLSHVFTGEDVTVDMEANVLISMYI